MRLLAFVALLAWLWLLCFRGRFWLSQPELPALTPVTAPPVAVIVPARDEAEVVAASLHSLLVQTYAGRLRIVLVDDGSSDGTAAIAQALPGAAERLTVIPGKERPPGWTGKVWAVEQGIAATDEELIVLTDADIVHDPAHISALVAQAERIDVDLVSEMVALHCATAAEQALIPAFVYFFQLLYPFAEVNDPLSDTAAAAGGTILLRRAALTRIGGMAAIRGALIDDVALAAAMKRGGRIWLGHSTLARSIRVYPELRDIWRMIARSAYVELRYAPWRVAAAVLIMAWLFFIPPLAALFSHHGARIYGWMAWLAMAVSLLPTLWRYRLSALRAPLLPAIAAFYMAATIGSALDHHFGRGVVWKRRAYGEGPE
jgi:hopene-associated glycosyltransferase HpnB